MIYTELTRQALKLCFAAHEYQVDKSGIPYVFHPFHLAEQMKDEASTVTALLHDVVEDTDYTLEDLRQMGYPEQKQHPCSGFQEADTSLSGRIHRWISWIV